MTKVLVATSFPSMSFTPPRDNPRCTSLTAQYHIHIHAVPIHITYPLSPGPADQRRRYAVHRLHLAVVPCDFLGFTKLVGATSASVTTSLSILAHHAFIHTAHASVACQHRLFAYS